MRTFFVPNNPFNRKWYPDQIGKAFNDDTKPPYCCLVETTANDLKEFRVTIYSPFQTNHPALNREVHSGLSYDEALQYCDNDNPRRPDADALEGIGVGQVLESRLIDIQRTK